MCELCKLRHFELGVPSPSLWINLLPTLSLPSRLCTTWLRVRASVGCSTRPRINRCCHKRGRPCAIMVYEIVSSVHNVSRNHATVRAFDDQAERAAAGLLFPPCTNSRMADSTPFELRRDLCYRSSPNVNILNINFTESVTLNKHANIRAANPLPTQKALSVLLNPKSMIDTSLSNCQTITLLLCHRKHHGDGRTIRQSPHRMCQSSISQDKKNGAQLVHRRVGVIFLIGSVAHKPSGESANSGGEANAWRNARMGAQSVENMYSVVFPCLRKLKDPFNFEMFQAYACVACFLS